MSFLHNTPSPNVVSQLNYVNSQLADIVSLPSASLTKVKRRIDFPVGWTWTDAPINIYKDGSGVITTDLDVSTMKNVGGVTYYSDIVNGRDSNDGLTPATAFKTIKVARAKSDVGTIIVKAGYYDDVNGFNGIINQNKNINIIAATGEDVTISTFREQIFTKSAGYTNVYEVSRTVVASVFDSKVLDSFGDYTKYTAKASIAEVDSTPGSYYYATPMLYIHALDSRVPDTDIRVSLSVKNYYCTGNYKTYLEGIKFYGGNLGCAYAGTTVSTDVPVLIAKNCEFKYATDGAGGFMVTGADSFLQNCITARNYMDGNNYHKGLTRIPRAIEVGCTSRRNGINRSSNQDNGSTIHDGGKIIRVNGNYYNNEGPNVHDISSGTESWNLGCEAHDTAATVANRKSNYRSEDLAKMWLDSCIGYGSETSLFVSSTGQILLKNCLFDKDDVVSGTLGYY